MTLMTIFYIALYLLVGALLTFLWHVWTLCYQGKWVADYNKDGGIYFISIVAWPLMLFFLLPAFLVVGSLFKLLEMIGVFSLLGGLAEKLAKKCSDFKTRRQ